MTPFKAASLVAAAVVLVAACDRVVRLTEPPRASSGAARAAIVDGAHGGNPHFFFLPPIAHPGPTTGVFDATLAPVVEICVWSGTSCSVPPVSRLTNVKVHRSGDDDEGEAEGNDDQPEGQPFYSVHWKTRLLQLDPARTYRIRVLVAGTELGSADVDVVRSAREARSVDRSRFVPLVAGQTLVIRFRIEKGAVTVLGAAGGQIVALDGQVQLDIPAGALSGDVGFTFKHVSGPPQPGGFVVPNGTIEFGPEGLKFNTPVRLTLRYDDVGIPAGAESKLRLHKLVGSDWVVVNRSTVDMTANTVTGLIDGFSTYGIVTWNGSEPTFEGFGTAVVDGVLSPGEWDPSASVAITVNQPGGGTSTGTLYVMNDATNLYLAFSVPRPTGDWNTSLQFLFDKNNDGQIGHGDEHLWMLAPSSNPTALFIDAWVNMTPPGCLPPTLVCSEDIATGGTQDGAGAFTNNGTVSIVEMAHPLNSGDTFDFSLSAGSTIAFFLALDIFDQPTRFGETLFPAAAWGHIRVASPLPLEIQPDTGTTIAGMNVTCALTVSRDAYCWGGNIFGALGNGSNTNSNVPVKVSGTESYAWISVGSAGTTSNNGHTCALTRTGEARCWGYNTFGQLGNGGNTSSNVPTAVLTAEKFQSISAGQLYTCGLALNFAAFCWGGNNSGKLGDGTQNVSNVPVAVSGNLAFSQISAGDNHTCGVTRTGDLYCWGGNGYGQLGLGVLGGLHLVPQKVAGSNYRYVSAGADHTCAVNFAGTIYCWGANHYGQLGDGTTTIRLSPTAIGSGYEWVEVGGESGNPGPAAHTCAVKTTLEAYCWGVNSSGQVGNGGVGGVVSSPVAVVGGHRFRRVSAGKTHSCGVTYPAGEAYCWGSDVYGELGVGGAPAASGTPLLVSGGLVFW